MIFVMIAPNKSRCKIQRVSYLRSNLVLQNIPEHKMVCVASVLLEIQFPRLYNNGTHLME